MKNKKPLVFFDAMGVIYPFPEGDDIKYGLWPFLESRGFTFSEEEKQVNEIEHYRRASRGITTGVEFLQTILPAGTKCEDIQHDYLASNKFWLAKDLIPTFQALKKHGIYIGILSNDIGTWSEILRERFGLDTYLDIVILSSDAKTRKPLDAIYEYAVMRADEALNPSSIYFVDDSLKNLESTRKFGIKSIYKVHRKDDRRLFEPDHRIQTLSEVITIVIN